MSIFKRWFGARPPEEPADGGPRSIHAILSAWDGQGAPPPLVPAGADSSTDAAAEAPPPGARDAALLARGRRPGDDDEEAIPILAPFRRACRSTDERHFRDLYEAARVTRLASCWEPFLERVRGSAGITPAVMRPIAQRLRRRAADPEPVKLGILVATALRDAEALPDVEVLSRHDEFGFWCVQAISAIAKDPVVPIWDLARRLRGWGRIHAVRRLSLDARRRPDVRDWILREGCRNDIAPGHLAAVCAAAGNLDEALSAGPADDALLDGAAQILAAMFVDQGPGPTWRNWKAAPAAARAYLAQLGGRPLTPPRRAAVAAIRAVAGSDALRGGTPPEDPDARDAWLDRRLAMEDAGWTPDLALELSAACDRLLAAPVSPPA
jgi:hypothetical protein